MVKPPLNLPDLTGWGVWGATSWRAIRQIWGQVDVISAAPWLARCYPSGQIPRISAILRGCARHFIADTNHEPNLHTITVNVVTLTTRPLRRHLPTVFRGVLQRPRPPWKKEGKIPTDSGNRTHVGRLKGELANHPSTPPRYRKAKPY